MNDNERRKFIYAIRSDKGEEYDEGKALKQYQKFINSSDFDNFRNVKVSPYCGDTER